MRPMRWWDIAPVMALEDELFGDEAWSDAMFWSELAQPQTRMYLVAEAATSSDGAIVGYAGLCAYAPHEAYVQTIAVAPGHQRRGVGTRLLDAVVGEAARRRCRHIDLEVRADNDTAIALYQRHGFVQTGRRRGYYQPSGTDALVMRKELAR